MPDEIRSRQICCAGQIDSRRCGRNLLGRNSYRRILAERLLDGLLQSDRRLLGAQRTCSPQELPQCKCYKNKKALSSWNEQPLLECRHGQISTLLEQFPKQFKMKFHGRGSRFTRRREDAKAVWLLTMRLTPSLNVAAPKLISRPNGCCRRRR